MKILITSVLCLKIMLAGCAASLEQAPVRPGIAEAPDGVPIAYESFGAGDTAVVFIHCWACNRAFWRHQVEPLVEAGYRVITLDLPGHGDSGANRDIWSIVALGDDVEAVVRKLDLKRVVLVGHSIGARAALSAASQMPDRVIGIGCVDSLRNAEFEWPDGMMALIAEYMRENFVEGTRSIVSPVLHPGTDSELADWIFDQVFSVDQAAAVALLADFPTADLGALLSDAGVPVRCVNAAARGSQSLPTEIELNRKYADFGAVVMDGVGHYLQLEKSDVFNAHLLKILADFTGQSR